MAKTLVERCAEKGHRFKFPRDDGETLHSICPDCGALWICGKKAGDRPGVLVPRGADEVARGG